MTYSTSNPPMHVPGGPLTQNSTTTYGRHWWYSSTDPSTQVAAAGYFTNPGDLGVKLGDYVMVDDTTNKLLKAHHVITAASTTVTLSSGVTLGSST